MPLGELFVKAPAEIVRRVILMLNELPHQALQNASVTLPGVNWLLVEQARLVAVCWQISRATSPVVDVRQHDGMRCGDCFFYIRGF